MDMINLGAGVLLILFGLRFLRKGFARVMGGDMIDWLQDFTRTRSRAWAGGVAGGVVMPSSTAAALLSVQMTRRGNVTWENVLAVLLGAQLGTTALIQVLSFDLRAYAGLFIAAGAALFLYVEEQRPRGIGQALLAFGFMLLGMGLLGDAARALGSDPAVSNLFAALGQLPLLFLIAAALLTLLMQSATASIALALALVASGQVSLTMLLLWVLGANIGLSLTVLLAGWSDLQGRRLGLANLFIKLPLAMALAALILSAPLPWLESLPGALPQQAAWGHTLFNLAACAAILFAATLGRLVRVLVAEPAEPGSTRATSMDPLLLQNPALALNAVLRETLQVFDQLHLMREKIMLALSQGEVPGGLKGETEHRRRHILAVCDELVEFLDAIPDDSLDEDDELMKETLDDFMRELPIIVRALGPELYGEVTRLLRNHPEALESARPLLIEAAARLSQQMNTVTRMLMRERPELGRKILERKQENSSWLIQAKRTQAGLPYPAWEILDDFQQINRRLSGVAYVYCRHEPQIESLDT
ncbi:MAG: Na/Pi cotransporter family protein [Gammaproteobacteria bacterium]|nr:Na/Pi cotransporter family protein [Gammaproteobacteria bacterium]TVQ50526.1 MAG: Na/Pi cotransporter family protein [Gammaproteobacteria bacterium]